MSAREPAPRAAAAERCFEEEALGKAYDARLLRAALALRRAVPARGGAHAAAGLPAACLLELAPAWIVKTGLDHLVGRGDGRVAQSGRWLAPPGGPAAARLARAASTWR